MSVYIKGMDMPKRCAECTFETLFSDDMHYCAVEEIAKEIPTEDYWECRPSFCPMSEVPEPHGRLIDADELIEWAEEEERTGLSLCIDKAEDLETTLDDNASTVIERSEK